MQMYLLSFPLWTLFLVLVVGSGVLVAGASLLVNRYCPQPSDDNGVGLSIFQTVGAVFGITLAFTISAVYAEFDVAAGNVSHESNALGRLYRLAQQLPLPHQTDLQTALDTYADHVINTEWRTMEQGRSSIEVVIALNQLWHVHRQLEQSEPSQHTRSEHFYQHVVALTDHRRNRLRDSHSQLPPLMWGLLLGGGFITVAFAVALRTGHNRSQACMTGCLAAVIGFGLLLVMAMDCPYSGSVRVSPDALIDTLQLYNRPPYGPM